MQPTAKSAWLAPSSIGIAPAEWARSHKVTAPCSCALRVDAAMSWKSSGAVINLRQHHNGHALVDGSGDPLGLNDPHLQPAVERAQEGVRDVEVRREIAGCQTSTTRRCGEMQGGRRA